ncbi:MAG TPA: nickel pincer cofactor biosynthesis protein LarC [bacterium]|nr:nickel pincer cofactor biosynthesis protein LarC [bacterium]
MKIAYFDCFAGASGDMILGALLDAGLDFGKLKAELKRLKLSGYTLTAGKTLKKNISATAFRVKTTHDHHHRILTDILSLISESGLDRTVQDRCKKVFTRLAEAEARIHNKPVERIHFHEVGAVDSIIDIVGTCAGLHLLGIQQIHASRLHVGTGFLQCAHGTLPVPPPATLELLKSVPVYSTGIDQELVTPTGAALLSTLSQSFDAMPAMRVQHVGYGAGERDLGIPNVLRVVLGDAEHGYESDTVQILETNIDDMNPQFYEYIMETLFLNGARDVFLTPIIMKKNRPGVVLSVLCSPDRVQALTDIMLRETTTLGIRISEVRKRVLLKREIRKVSTIWGEARVKIRTLDSGEVSAAPEYDDCKRIAGEHGIALRDVFDAVKKAAEEIII